MAINVRTLGELVATARAAGAVYDASAAAVLLRFAWLYTRHRYRREEIFALGLADPRLTGEDLAAYVSENKHYDMQLKYNPVDYNYMTEDKVFFYLFCKGAGIPTPEIYAVFGRGAGWSTDGRQLNTRADWRDHFAAAVPEHFVIKPALGSHGKSIGVFQRAGDGFVDFAGTSYTGDDLYDHMAGDPDYDRFVVQERLTNHPALVELSGSAALQSVRTVTLINDNETPEIIFANQRIIAGANVNDNFAHGATGNMVASVNADGVITKVVGRAGSGFGMQEIDVHPDTKARLVGFEIPYWATLRPLVEDAARKLLPIRTVGWDVALTPAGPVILEGNMWWQPGTQNALREIRRFVEIYRGS